MKPKILEKPSMKDLPFLLQELEGERVIAFEKYYSPPVQQYFQRKLKDNSVCYISITKTHKDFNNEEFDGKEKVGKAMEKLIEQEYSVFIF